MRDLDEFVLANQTRMLHELRVLLRIPSISSDPAHERDCRRAAEWVANHLRALGCPSVELLGSDTHPVVHARGPTVPGRPTVVVYGHYDVQPPDPLERWVSPPFEPVVRNGRLHARGATDDKGQFFAIIKAFEALNDADGPPVNVRFLIEGQEESGGTVLLALVNERPELLQADAALVADGPYYAPGWPAVEVGVRGLCYAEIVVRTLREDLHSGLYGGVAPNAHDALARILAALKTPAGRIRIPGLSESVRRPGRRERDSWKHLPFDLSAFTRDEVGSTDLVGDVRYSVHERMWARPTLDVHGITGGFTGDGIKTVIPAEARAKVSLRLVPDQRAEAVFRKLVRAVEAAAPEHARAELELLAAVDPVLVDTSHPVFSLIDRAFREVEGRGVSFTRTGGTLPILGALGREGAAVVMAGIGLPEDGLHAPNEGIGIDQFLKGIRVFGRFLAFMGNLNGGVSS